MNSMIYDFRYPFNDLQDFFLGLYFLKLEALHLTIGYIFFIYFILNLLLKTKFDLCLRLTTIYFAGAIFNNPAYTIFGITIAEIFGIIAAILFIIRNTRFPLNPISNYMFFFSWIALTHLLIISIFNEAVQDSLEFKRFAVILKVIFLSINIIVLFKYLKDDVILKDFVLKNIFLFNIVAICYLVQLGVFVSGVLPYGSFSPAGWTESPIPSFGSTSIERGHFGKFFVPLFPLYLFSYRKYATKKSFMLFLLISFLNLSASSYSFLSVYILLTFLIFIKELKGVIFLILLYIIIFYSFFIEQIFGLFVKIYELAILQYEEGGRSFSLLLPILEINNYLGYGYGGSTYRNYHGIEGLDLNNSIVVFFGQLSFIGFIVVLSFIYLIYKISLNVNSIYGNSFAKKLLFIAIFTMIFIFLSDVLYFVYTIWLPIVVLYIHLTNKRRI